MNPLSREEKFTLILLVQKHLKENAIAIDGVPMSDTTKAHYARILYKLNDSESI